jgi:hypothetical protein
MINQLMQVKAFMSKFKQELHNIPVESMSGSGLALRLRLTHEETKEFANAFSYNPETGEYDVDQAEALDGLCDRLYCLLGDALSVGMGYLLPVAFRIVHESNMTKLWTAAEVAALPSRTDVVFELVAPGTDRPYLVYDPLGKVMKSKSYQPADLSELLEELGGQQLLCFTKATQLVFGDEPEPDTEQDEDEGGNNPF